MLCGLCVLCGSILIFLPGGYGDFLNFRRNEEIEDNPGRAGRAGGGESARPSAWKIGMAMPPVSLKKVDILVAILLFPVCTYVFYEAGSWPRLPDLGNPGWIPSGVSLCLLIATIMMLARALRGRSLTLPGRLEGVDRARVLWVAAITVGYVAVMGYLGFIASTIPYLAGFGIALGERRWARLGFFSVAVPLAIYLVFDATLNVPLPRGWLR